jgi:hypothetical protein
MRPRIAVSLIIAAAAATALACGGEAPCSSGTGSCSAPASPSPAASGPALSQALASGCFGWPATEFTPSTKASVTTHVQPGSRAVAFSLRDTDGAEVTLSGLLTTRPVLLVHGAFT